MDRFEPPARPRARPPRPPSLRRALRWPLPALIALLLVTGVVLLVNQRHSGDPLKLRRELRKF